MMWNVGEGGRGMMWGWGQGDVQMLWESGGQGGREIFGGGAASGYGEMSRAIGTIGSIWRS